MPAAGRGTDADDVARPKRQVVDLADVTRLGSVRIHDGGAGGSGGASGHAPRLDLEPLLPAGRDDSVGMEDLEVHPDRHARPVPARTARIRIRSYRRITIGTSASMLSIGVFRRKPCVGSQPWTPSIDGPAPPPPIIGSTTVTCRRPVAGFISEHTTGEIAPAEAAGTLSGAACTRQPSTASERRSAVPKRTPHAPGNSGLTTVPLAASWRSAG